MPDVIVARSRVSGLRVFCRSAKALPALLVVLLGAGLLLSTPARAQQTGLIEGTVVSDATGEPLPGVNVLVENTQQGAATNADGTYAITGVEPGTYTVRASFISYGDEVEEGVEVLAGETTTVNFTMQEAAQGLDEVVVIGYGTQDRKDLTGSISSVTPEEIGSLPVTSIDQVLDGTVAGVSLSEGNAAPGEGMTIRIRGAGSISAGNEPLYVVDGFPVSSSSAVDPDNVESIEVLKDASSTAIYGSRGSNGVVLITTKSGRSGETSVNVKARYGFQQAANRIDVLNAEEFAQFVIEGRNNSYMDRGLDPSVPITEREPPFTRVPEALANPSELGEGTDWQDEIFRTAATQEYNVSASGGNETARFFVSGGYTREEGVVIGSDFDKFSLQANIDADLTDRLRVRTRLAPSLSQRSVIDTEQNGVVYYALLASPHLSVRDEDGNYNWDGLNIGPAFIAMDNPVAIARLEEDERTSLSFLGNVAAEFDLTDHLTLESTLGADIGTYRRSAYQPSSLGEGRTPPPTTPDGDSDSSQDITWLNENTLSYDRVLGDNHDLDVLAGFTAQKNRSESNFLNASNFPNDLVQTLNAGQITGGGSFASEWSLLSLLGRVNYSYNDKYLLTATVRRDGSSRFGEGNRWGTFPSAALGWRVSEEPFMEPASSFVSNLKLRVSYGLTGNFSIGNYEAIGRLSGADAILGPGLGVVRTGLVPSSLPNPDLNWERSRSLNVGVDAGFFDERLRLTADAYRRTTSDLLLNVQVPSTSGFTNVFRNIGEVRNEGLEIAVQPNIASGDFQWDANYNISFNRNEVLALGPSGAPLYSSVFGDDVYVSEVGGPLGAFYGLDYIGVFRTQEEIDNNPSYDASNTAYSRPGDYRYRDVNGDGEITLDGDRTKLGDANPDFTFGIRNRFTFKNLSLNLQIDGNYGAKVFDGLIRRLGNLNPYVNQYREAWEGRYVSPEQPGSGFSRTNRTPTGLTTAVSDRYIQGASFLRLRSASLSYQVPSGTFGQLFRGGVEVYLAARNVFTLTPYDGYNPEVSNSGGNPIRPGYHFGTYPVARSFTLGTNLRF